jgi:hypothetical protein
MSRHTLLSLAIVPGQECEATSENGWKNINAASWKKQEDANQARGMFSARPSSGPRSRCCMDYQGQGKANAGEVECMGIIDSFSKWVDFYPLHDRAAETLAPILLDQVHFKHGPPDILHSDEAQTYMSKLLQAPYDRLGCHRTTNLGHHAEGNIEIEVVWRFWNRCMRILPPSHYQKWPLFASQVAWAHNTTPQDSLGNVSSFEMQHGTLPRSPFDPDPNFKPDSQLPTRDLGDPDEHATAIRESAAAFKELATRHQEHVRKDTARKLNKQGTSTHFELGGRVIKFTHHRLPPTSNAPAAPANTSSAGAVPAPSTRRYLRQHTE